MQSVVSKNRMDSFMLGPDTRKIVSSFNNYGCWCVLDKNTNFEISMKNEKNLITIGKPKTQIDTFCQELKVEYHRIEQNFENFNNATNKIQSKCDPYNTKYNNKGFSVKRSAGLDMQFRSGICEKMNRADCAIQVCKAEMVFVKKLHDYIFFDENDDRDAFKHDNGFNVTKFC